MEPVPASHADVVAVVERQAALIAELRATVAAQQTTIARLEQRIQELERSSGTPRGMPGHKPGPAPERSTRPARRARQQQFTRPRSQPTQRVIHVVTHCPTCGLALAGGSVKRTREVIEVTPTPVTVTEHVYLERCCPGCGRRHTPAAELSGVVVGQSRLGVRLVSLIATLREEARLPLRAIQRYLASLHGLELSVGTLVGALGQVARVGQPALTALAAQVRASPVVHANETGWREDGRNGFIWTFSTPDSCYLTHGGRGKGMVAQVLDGADGVLVSDFYAAYDHYPGAQQKCWAHLLRDIHDLRVRSPADAGERHAGACHVQVGDGHDVQAGGARRLRQEHGAELAGPDHPDADGRAGLGQGGKLVEHAHAVLSRVALGRRLAPAHAAGQPRSHPRAGRPPAYAVGLGACWKRITSAPACDVPRCSAPTGTTQHWPLDRCMVWSRNSTVKEPLHTTTVSAVSSWRSHRIPTRSRTPRRSRCDCPTAR